jgi:predicted PurR-regulated permease PerM
MRRPLAIVLSFVLVIGVIVGVAFLLLPELMNAVSIVVSSLTNGLDQLVEFENAVDYSKIPFGEQLSQIDIDFLHLKDSLNEWLKQVGTIAMDTAASALGSMAAMIVDFVIGIVFSIYILANKEKLKRQVTRLIRVWLPVRFADQIIHISAVCGKNFKLFVAGQTTEAIILGSLCAIGMLILRIPYAPMIGALVGVTALIPYVGAWIATLVGAFMILTVNPFKALVFIIFLLTLQQIEGNAIYPKVVGAKINLPAMWVLTAITIGGNLGGPIGMLLGVPTAASVYSLLREVTDSREKEQNRSADIEKRGLSARETRQSPSDNP